MDTINSMLECMVTFLACGCGFYGLSYCAGKLSTDVYLSTILLSGADILGYMAALTANSWGRTRLQGACFALAGCCFSPFIQTYCKIRFHVNPHGAASCLVSDSFLVQYVCLSQFRAMIHALAESSNLIEAYFCAAMVRLEVFCDSPSNGGTSLFRHLLHDNLPRPSRGTSQSQRKWLSYQPATWRSKYFVHANLRIGFKTASALWPVLHLLYFGGLLRTCNPCSILCDPHRLMQIYWGCNHGIYKIREPFKWLPSGITMSTFKFLPGRCFFEVVSSESFIIPDDICSVIT